MFGNEIAINELQIGLFTKVVNDIPEDKFFEPGVGHGHPPVWILGHLAICGEIGQQLLGGSVAHPQWFALFGPGSSDKIAQDPTLNKTDLVASVIDAYQGFRTLAANADQATVDRAHGFALFDGSPIKTVSHFIALLLTNHFGFHLAQLSSCRRSEGHNYLF